MAWTAPRTWTDGETVTAAMLNSHVRDNLNALGSVPVTSLPGGPTNGDMCVLTDSLTVPTLQWTLRYNSTASLWQALSGWGFNTTFPSTTTLDLIPFTLVDSVTAPTYAWSFRYQAGISDANKWVFTGGSPVRAYVATSETTSSATYANLATSGPTFTVPRAGVYKVEISAQTSNGSGLAAAAMTVKVGGAAASDTQAAIVDAPSNSNRAVMMSRTQDITFAASDVALCQYKVSANTETFANRSLTITPVRVA